MLMQAVQHLIQTSLDYSSSDEAIRGAAQAVLNDVGAAETAEVEAALARLAASLQDQEIRRGAFLALVCGAIVERGYDPAPLFRPLTAHLQQVLEDSVRLANVIRDKMPKPGNEDEAPEEIFEKTRQLFAPAMPEENTSWEALKISWRPAIAAFSASPSARASAGHLRDQAAEIAEVHEAGHWLRFMLSTLDNEPVLVIEPQTKMGILARMSGVADNFQLNVLLMDIFPQAGEYQQPRVDHSVADNARGVGPQSLDNGVTGVWNLYTWRAVDSNGSMPDASEYGSRVTWIWNEGVPADIPVFNGRRVILLGPAAYQRNWRCSRIFRDLPAAIEIERSLTTAEIENWLKQMAEANTAD